jgi:hypothetical protein
MLSGSDRRAHLRRLERLREGFMKKVGADSAARPLALTLALSTVGAPTDKSELNRSSAVSR